MNNKNISMLRIKLKKISNLNLISQQFYMVHINNNNRKKERKRKTLN
jgi:hypothetical protein